MAPTKKTSRSYRKSGKATDELNYKFSYNDDETSEIQTRLNGTLSITVYDFRRVSLWKSDRVLKASDQTLRKMEKLSVNSNVSLRGKLVQDVLNQLVLSQGIGFPIARVILKFINPTVFPIIHAPAYRALAGKKPHYDTYNYEKYMEYAEELTEIARDSRRPLREVDEQLYCFDAQYNGKI
ncbi:MAG: hypothetical protein FAZ92_01182 [Accumulibacter sp.]|uniref:hypothetical protein n=1 Tax=Accumulibacter sp. TaxID=2053492 RepID=UPI00120FC4D1|nr:hypothetical protein [Accumulibacter sp.]TLD46524.1 MAG: hypothetical protein FAZ92_01182 [Accumulibacter sp.]